jgi:2'-5' RNA ligase
VNEWPKTHCTAAVLIPPPSVWEPIQRIRRAHDPQVRRWMPHVTLLFPFVPESRLAEAAERLAAVCRTHAPLRFTLSEFRSFEHHPGAATLWLEPMPREPIIDLQADLEGEFPSCDDASRFESGFVPHLSVGRFPGSEAVAAALRQFQFAWMPIECAVDAVSLLARSGAPDDPFHVRHTVSLGGGG